MIDQVAAAFNQGDYRTAAHLLQDLQAQSPEDPWVQFYVGRLQEVSGELEAAIATYRHLLREFPNSKLATQARQGLQRVQALEKAQRQQAIAAAKSDPANTGSGFLVLESITGEARLAVAQSLARIIKLDPYTAQAQLPSRGWRLYRTGPLAELQVYGQELLNAGIPVFWVPLAAIEKIRVFRVNHFQAVTPQVVAVCQNEMNQLGSIAFNWSEVARRVEGLLPIFEKVVDLDVRLKLQRKEQTQDYAHFCDLHLPDRQCILRICDSNYQFQQGVDFSRRQNDVPSMMQTTVRLNWNNLLKFFNQNLPSTPVWSDFTPFAETALEQLDLAPKFKPHIDLFRRAETSWDSAFQLYSGLVFLKLNSQK